jgi:DNA-binding GntR family transcriptional regulator
MLWYYSSDMDVSIADLREAIQQLEEEGIVGVSGDVRNRTLRVL